jgi:hypothetical protein
MGMLACCKGLQTAGVALAKKLAGSTLVLVTSQLYVTGFIALPSAPLVNPVPIEYETGPPGKFSFAEVVLQHSLRGNGPPLSA